MDNCCSEKIWCCSGVSQHRRRQIMAVAARLFFAAACAFSIGRTKASRYSEKIPRYNEKTQICLAAAKVFSLQCKNAGVTLFSSLALVRHPSLQREITYISSLLDFLDHLAVVLLFSSNPNPQILLNLQKSPLLNQNCSSKHHSKPPSTRIDKESYDFGAIL